MTLGEAGKRGISVLALAMRDCAAGPSWSEDWTALRPIDLPAILVRATWTDEVYLSDGHPIQFGRMAIYLKPSDTTRPISVRVVTNGGYGYVVDNLTCYNVLSGASMCTILLDPPKYCHLFINPKSKNPDSEHFDVPCPVDLSLGN